MNKLKKIFTLFLILFLLVVLFKYKDILEISVIKATDLWLKKVFPMLFMMFILNDIIIKTNILASIPPIFKKIFNKIFKTQGDAIEAFILSIFSGCPANAFILKEMVQNKKITNKTANKLISFTYFVNPLFLYNILNLSFNKFITIKIILTIYFSNIIIGLFRKNTIENDEETILSNNDEEEKYNLFLILPSAILKSINTLLMILGTITFYMIISNLIIKLTNLSLLNETILRGFLEITQALNILPNIIQKSIIKEIIAIIIISFGGLSIHTQILQILEGTRVSYKNFCQGRIYQILISTTTYIIIYILTS